jgi:hypothetical protein
MTGLLTVAVVLIALGLERAAAQYADGTTLFTETMGLANAVLNTSITNLPDLEMIFYPNKYRLPTDYYTFLPPDRAADYTQNVIFNPCQGYEYNCCSDTYGTPEYLIVDSDPASPGYGTRQQQLDDSSTLDPTASRLPDDEFFVDNSCTGANQPPGRTDCVIARVARRAPSMFPRCWNRNDTVVADQPCRSPFDGSVLPLCIELGVTQTNFVVECGGAFANDPHCGTFLEVHRPGFALSVGEVRLRGMYPSGYRMTVISTTYMQDSGRTLCYDEIKKGNYELWWVQRTLYNFVVERRIPFRVISPECDWDDPNNRYLDYATLFLPTGERRAKVLAGLNPFDPKNLLFTRQRVEGTASYPGHGMGSTLVPVSNSTYDKTARFDVATWHNQYTYAYTPSQPDYTVASGFIAPTQSEQVALAALRLKRGYRRLEDVPEEELDAMLMQVAAQRLGDEDGPQSEAAEIEDLLVRARAAASSGDLEGARRASSLANLSAAGAKV